MKASVKRYDQETVELKQETESHVLLKNLLNIYDTMNKACNETLNQHLNKK